MTKDEAIEMLENYRLRIVRMNRLRTRLYEALDTINDKYAPKSSVPLDGLPRASQPSDPTAATATLISDHLDHVITDIQQELDHITTGARKTERLFSYLRESEREILTLRYIDKHDWKTKADKMNVGTRQAIRIGTSTLDKLCSMAG